MRKLGWILLKRHDDVGRGKQTILCNGVARRELYYRVISIAIGLEVVVGSLDDVALACNKHAVGRHVLPVAFVYHGGTAVCTACTHAVHRRVALTGVFGLGSGTLLAVILAYNEVGAIASVDVLHLHVVLERDEVPSVFLQLGDTYHTVGTHILGIVKQCRAHIVAVIVAVV